MYRACELKDQTYKKTRTLQFSEIQENIAGELFMYWFRARGTDFIAG